MPDVTTEPSRAESVPVIEPGIVLTGIPVFRAGDYGPKGKYTVEHVREMAESYDPNFLEAPITPDHAQEGPSWGWVLRQYAVGDTLYQDWKVSDETLSLIRKGMYRYRSVEIYRAQPMPDGTKKHYIRAVSLLGAASPAVKGLGPIKFSAVEDTDNLVRIEFTDTTNTPAAAEEEEVQMSTTTNTTTPAATEQPVAMSTTVPASVDSAAPAATAAPQTVQFTINGQVQTFSAEQVQALYIQAQADAAERARLERELRFSADNAAFDAVFVPANREGRITEPMGRILRAIFHALPPEGTEGSTVNFSATEGEEAKPTSLRSLVLNLMSTAAKVVDVTQKPATDNFTTAASVTTVDFSNPAERGKAVVAKAEELIKDGQFAAEDYESALIKADSLVPRR